EINRAILHLTDKLNYLQQFNFELSKLESVRKSRLAETQLILGLRLIETGQTQKGRQMAWEQKSFSPLRAWTGLALSILPIEIRELAFKVIRRLYS
ncbi:MAG: glycosyl transferase family 2, partial [Trichodesmium sp. MAG_R04]|nr:glycosyl transferase family 2 [Trichodesmium sp. MAG_R04]